MEDLYCHLFFLIFVSVSGNLAAFCSRCPVRGRRQMVSWDGYFCPGLPPWCWYDCGGRRYTIWLRLLIALVCESSCTMGGGMTYDIVVQRGAFLLSRDHLEHWLFCNHSNKGFVAVVNFVGGYVFQYTWPRIWYTWLCYSDGLLGLCVMMVWIIGEVLGQIILWSRSPRNTLSS